MIEVEKGVPMPSVCLNSRGRPRKYPLDTMDVGDSFFCSEEKNAVASAISVGGKRLGRKFMQRKEGDGRRVWRIA